MPAIWNRVERRAEVRNRVEADDVRREERAGSDDRRQREGREEADKGRSRPHGPAEAVLAHDEDEAGAERRSEPHERAGVQHAEQSAETAASGIRWRNRSDLAASGTSAARTGSAHAVPISLMPPQSAYP